MRRKRVGRESTTASTSSKRARLSTPAGDDSVEESVEPVDYAASDADDDSVSTAEPSSSEEDDDGVDEQDAETVERMRKYARADRKTKEKMRQLWALLPVDYVVDPPDFSRPAPAKMSAYFQLGVPVYELSDSPHLSRLQDEPDVLLEHMKLDVSGRGFFPFKIPPPAVVDPAVSEGDPTLVPPGQMRLISHGEDSSRMIESIFQLQVTGAAVVEYRALLRLCGLVPGSVSPRYRIDSLATDPLRAEAGWLRHQHQWLCGGSDDLLTPFVDDDESIAKISASIRALGETLDSYAPFLSLGMEGALQTSGELFESSGMLFLVSLLLPRYVMPICC
jgi:hypothetical protein